jgi:hypothetical protein
VKNSHPLEYPEEGATMVRDPRKTWQYFAQAVIQEDDPEKLTYLMQQLYRVLKDNGEQPTRTIYGARVWREKRDVAHPSPN